MTEMDLQNGNGSVRVKIVGLQNPWFLVRRSLIFNFMTYK